MDVFEKEMQADNEEIAQLSMEEQKHLPGSTLKVGLGLGLGLGSGSASGSGSGLGLGLAMLTLLAASL